MAKYAYRDKDRKEVIYSNQAIKEDRDRTFYCPNPMCDAKLYICAIDGSKHAYFRATKSDSKHITNCSYGSSDTEFNENKFDESKFVYENAIDNLLRQTKNTSKVHRTDRHRTGEPKAHPPRTLRQIFSMCKSLPMKASYAGKEIGEMLLDDRSEYRYPNGCFGSKIIEATTKGKVYDDEKKEVYLVAPIKSEKYWFVLSFSDEKIYKTIRSEIYNNRGKVIVVAGRWKSSGEDNKFISEVFGKKQVGIIKK